MQIEGISSAWWVALLPQIPVQPNSIVDIIPQVTHNNIFDILKFSLSLKFQIYKYTGEESDADYEKYLQFPNMQIQALTKSIVSASDSDDTKMQKIENWVRQNITYTSDIKNYGQDEFWALPTMTLQKGKGDCEDGAFLMQSLALNAGVSADRLRTYGGLVKADEYGVKLSGHAWTAYKRETDNQWVITDWCYWPSDYSIQIRPAMKIESNYVDDFFYVTATETVETSYVNKIRDPEIVFLPKNVFIDITV